MEVQIRDEGRTELAPGTLTTGVEKSRALSSLPDEETAETESEREAYAILERARQIRWASDRSKDSDPDGLWSDLYPSEQARWLALARADLALVPADGEGT